MVCCTPSACFGTVRVVVKHSVILFAAFSPVLPLSGCGGGLPATIPISGPVTPVVPPAPTINHAVTAAEIYSIDLGSESVDVYAANLNGTASPSSSYLIGGALTVTGDAAGNLYFGTSTSTATTIQVYQASSTTKSRSITVAMAAVNAPQISTLAVDSEGNLYVAISGSINVYSPTATGVATPIRTIAGSLTTLFASTPVTQMAFDANDDLFVAMGAGYKGSQVVDFAAKTNGNVAPTIITSADYYPSGVAIDSAGSIYISQSGSSSSFNGTYLPAIYVFPKGSVSGATPTRSITGLNTGFATYVDELFVDSSGNIFVGAVLDGQTDFLVFSATANGNVAPSSVLTRGKGSTTDSQFFVR